MGLQWSAPDQATCRGHVARRRLAGILTRVDRHPSARHMARLPHRGQVAEWLKAADCKSARASVRWFESSPVHHELEAIGP